MRLMAITVCAIALVSGAIAYAAFRPGSPEGGPSAAHMAGKTNSGLKARGHVDGLYPGARSRLRVRIKNPYGFAIVVRRVKARVRAAAVGCGPESLTVGRFHGHRLIPPGAARRVRLPIAMAATATEACQGARFPLRFGVRATRAGT